jgi:geranylgeranyl pyrophosphate synthase
VKTVTDAVYNLIENLLPQDEMGSSYTNTLLSLVRAAHARAEKNPSLTDLPILCCQAAGGDIRRAVPVTVAWWLLHLAAQVLDDIEDGEPECAFWAALGAPQALNAATGLIFAAQCALSGLPRLGVPASLALALLDDFGQTILRMCAGQHADLAQKVTGLSLEQYRAIMVAKSSDPFALACRAGAKLGTEDARLVACYAEFGYNLGVLVQISDDLLDLQEPSQWNDLATGQQTLPILYALSVAHPSQQATLRQLLLQAPEDAEAEVKARQIIISLGAPTYLLAEAQVHRRRAKEALRAVGQFNLAHDQLLALVDQVMPGASLIHPTGGTKGALFPSPNDENR